MKKKSTNLKLSILSAYELYILRRGVAEVYENINLSTKKLNVDNSVPGFENIHIFENNV
jgi:hypothetical protein